VHSLQQLAQIAEGDPVWVENSATAS